MANQIQSCFERYEKKYMLTPAQLRVRSYGVAAPEGKVFVEIKKKFDGVVYKRRITFDTGLRWRDTDLDLRLGDQGAPLLGPDQVLMEIKIPGTCPLWLSHLLDRAGARPVSFSKYGTCYQQHILPRIRAEQQNHQNNHHRQEEIRCA